MLIALETATSVCSVALWNGSGCVAEASLFRPRKHAEMLLPMLRDLLRAADVDMHDIDAVAVSKGPGSYTGLRIGASTAKGLAWAADAELVGVSSLEALASVAVPQAGPGAIIAAVLPSRRQDVYVSVFSHRLERVIDDAALPAAAAAGVIAECDHETVWVVGGGSDRILPFLPAGAHGLPATTHRPSAEHVARLGWDRFVGGKVEDLFTFEPFYLNASPARPAKKTAFEKLSF